MSLNNHNVVNEKLEAEAFAYLRKAAEETVFYVALGNSLKQELAQKYGLTEENVGGLLSKVAVNLGDKIRLMTKNLS